jgi:hypothetical protein
MSLTYVIDTSSLRFMKDNYPEEFAESLWKYISKLNEEGRIIILKVIKLELKKGKDYLSGAFLEGKTITSEKEEIVVNSSLPIILSSLSEKESKGSINLWIKKADPWLLAYTHMLKNNKNLNVRILTEEKIKDKKLRIPYIGSLNNIECLNVFDFFREEGIKFELSSPQL